MSISQAGSPSSKTSSPADFSKLRGSLRWLLLYRALQLARIHNAFLVLFLLECGFSLDQVAAFFIADQIMGTALGIPTGWFADKYGYRLSLIIGSFSAATGYCALALLPPKLEFVLPLTLLFGISQLTFGANASLAYSLHQALGYSGDQYEAYERYCFRYTLISQALATLLGAGLAQLFGLSAVMLASFVVWGSAGLVAYKLIEPKHYNQQSIALRATLASLPRRRDLLAVISVAITFYAFAYVGWWLRPMYFSAIEIGGQNIPASIYGVVYTAYLLGGVVGTWASVKVFRACSSSGGLLAILLVGCAGYLVLCLPPAWWGLLIFVLPEAVTAMSWPHFNRKINELAEPHERATIMSLKTTSCILGLSLSTWLTQRVMSGAEQPLQAGMLSLVLVGGLLTLATIVLYARTSRRSRQSNYLAQ